MSSMERYQQSWCDAGGVRHQATGQHSFKRIVSVVPSLTETLCAIGGRERLIGITAYCIRPQGLLKDSSVTKVGGTKRFNREKLLALNPDLVLLNLEENELDDIEFLKARVECYVNGVKTLQDGIESIRELGALLNCEGKAEKLSRQAEQLLNSRQTKSKNEKQNKPLLWYPIWRDPWMSIGDDTFIADHFRQLGVKPLIVQGRDSSRYPVTSLKEIGAAKPDIVWLPSEPYSFSESDRQELLKVPGFENARIQLVNGDHVCWFGVRQIEGIVYTQKLLAYSEC